MSVFGAACARNSREPSEGRTVARVRSPLHRSGAQRCPRWIVVGEMRQTADETRDESSFRPATDPLPRTSSPIPPTRIGDARESASDERFSENARTPKRDEAWRESARTENRVRFPALSRAPASAPPRPAPIARRARNQHVRAAGRANRSRHPKAL